MKALLKRALKAILFLLSIPVLYIIIALILTNITINPSADTDKSELIYLSTNGVHLDIIIPQEKINDFLKKNLVLNKNVQYVAFGWGDENFYLKTETWDDLTFANAFQAMFMESSSLMHIVRYNRPNSYWTPVEISKQSLLKLNRYIEESFKKDKNGSLLWLENQGYTSRDDFYKAVGSYSYRNTCNSWANRAFKESDIKACYWTPFDFGLLQKFE